MQIIAETLQRDWSSCLLNQSCHMWSRTPAFCNANGYFNLYWRMNWLAQVQQAPNHSWALVQHPSTRDTLQIMLVCFNPVPQTHICHRQVLQRKDSVGYESRRNPHVDRRKVQLFELGAALRTAQPVDPLTRSAVAILNRVSCVSLPRPDVSKIFVTIMLPGPCRVSSLGTPSAAGRWKDRQRPGARLHCRPDCMRPTCGRASWKHQADVCDPQVCQMDAATAGEAEAAASTRALNRQGPPEIFFGAHPAEGS